MIKTLAFVFWDGKAERFNMSNLIEAAIWKAIHTHTLTQTSFCGGSWWGAGAYKRRHTHTVFNTFLNNTANKITGADLPMQKKMCVLYLSGNSQQGAE